MRTNIFCKTLLMVKLAYPYLTMKIVTYVIEKIITLNVQLGKLNFQIPPTIVLVNAPY
jgi:hypothetical protein